MNIFRGNIKTIQSQGNFSLVSIQCKHTVLKAILIGNPAELPDLAIGRSVKLMFKETEVILARNHISEISLVNQFLAIVTNIQVGEIMSRIILKHPDGEVAAVISSIALQKLNLSIDEKIYVMIETNEIMLSV